MRIEELIVPQLGEGLQEARIVDFFKQPGEQVLRDEPLYQIETDKAGMDIESPFTGILQAWLANEGDLVPVGSPIARIEISVEGQPSEHHLPASSSSEKSAMAALSTTPSFTSSHDSLIIPPRTRAYCRKFGISPEEMRRISAQNGKKLMPADVDRYLVQQTVEKKAVGYQERLLTSQQRTLIHRLKRSREMVVPASLTYQLDFHQLRQAKEGLQHSFSEFELLAYLVAQASTSHPLFRSTLSGEQIRQYDHLNLGVAVHRPNDDLVTAVIEQADALELPSFAKVTRQQVERALLGEDQVSESTQLLLTYMVDYGVIAANPVLVAPAIAIIFVGAPYPQGDTLKANLTITFDHRLINGVAAAKFAEAIALKLKNLASSENGPHPLTAGASPDPVSRGASFGRGGTFSRSSPLSQSWERGAGGVRARPADLLREQLMAEVVPFLSQDVAQVALDLSWRELGLNSRLSLELVNALTTRFGRSFPATLLWNYPTIQSLLSHLAEKLELEETHPQPLSRGESDRLMHQQITRKEPVLAESKVEAIEALSDDEAELLLAKKLELLAKKGK